MPAVRFGLFDFNPETGELFREGRVVRLQAQPAKLLALLIAANGELVTRDALCEALWPDGTNVDFDRGLNFAVAQVRTALGDSADSPAFVRTVPKRGYQFIAPVTGAAAETTGRQPGRSRSIALLVAAAAVALAAISAAAVWTLRPAAVRKIAVARFQNETGNPAWDRFSDNVTDSLVAGLTLATTGRFGIVGNAAMLRRPRSFQDLDEIASTLGAEYVILGQVKQDGPRVRVLAHLIHMPEETHVTVSRLDVDGSASESQLAERIASDFVPRLASSGPISR